VRLKSAFQEPGSKAIFGYYSPLLEIINLGFVCAKGSGSKFLGLPLAAIGKKQAL